MPQGEMSGMLASMICRNFLAGDGLSSERSFGDAISRNDAVELPVAQASRRRGSRPRRDALG